MKNGGDEHGEEEGCPKFKMYHFSLWTLPGMGTS